MRTEYIEKPQPTIKGYAAFVLRTLVERKGVTKAEVTSWMVERWIEDNRLFLAKEFSVSREEYLRSQNILQYPGPQK